MGEPDIAALINRLKNTLSVKPELTSEEDSLAEGERISYQDEARRWSLNEQKNATKWRLKYSHWVFFVSISWMAIAVVVVISSGIKCPEPRKYANGDPHELRFYDWLAAFDVSDAVLIALISTTTANVLGLFYIVMRYYFPRHDARKG